MSSWHARLPYIHQKEFTLHTARPIKSLMRTRKKYIILSLTFYPFAVYSYETFIDMAIKLIADVRPFMNYNTWLQFSSWTYFVSHKHVFFPPKHINLFICWCKNTLSLYFLKLLSARIHLFKWGWTIGGVIYQ